MAYWTTETRPMFNAEYDRQMRMIRNMTLTEWLTLADTLGLRRNDREGAAYRLAFRALQQRGIVPVDKNADCLSTT